MSMGKAKCPWWRPFTNWLRQLHFTFQRFFCLVFMQLQLTTNTDFMGRSTISRSAERNCYPSCQPSKTQDDWRPRVRRPPVNKKSNPARLLPSSRTTSLLSQRGNVGIGINISWGRSWRGRAWPQSFQGGIFPLGAFHSPQEMGKQGPHSCSGFPLHCNANPALQTPFARPFYAFYLSRWGRRGTPGSSSGRNRAQFSWGT